MRVQRYKEFSRYARERAKNQKYLHMSIFCCTFAVAKVLNKYESTIDQRKSAEGGEHVYSLERSSQGAGEERHRGGNRVAGHEARAELYRVQQL